MEDDIYSNYELACNEMASSDLKNYMIKKNYLILGALSLGGSIVMLVLGFLVNGLGIFRFLGFGLLAVALWMVYFTFEIFLMKGEEKKNAIKAQMILMDSINLSRQERKRYRFKYDVLFRRKIRKKVCEHDDAVYSRNIDIIENKLKKLKNDRICEIESLRLSRWEKYDYFKVNREEGLVRILDNDYYFYEIVGAYVQEVYGNRVENHQEKVTTEKTTKSMSVGGAILGGMVGGVVGAAIGGALFAGEEKKQESHYETRSENISTCERICVVVNLKGFDKKIVIMDTSADVGSSEYKKALCEADDVVDQLRELASTEVPRYVIPIEQKPSVIAIDQEIYCTEDELEAAKNDVPKYEIPLEYQDIEICGPGWETM